MRGSRNYQLKCRMYSIGLIIAVLFTSIPFPVMAQQNEQPMNIIIHALLSDWEEPALHVWGGEATVTGNGDAKEVPGWGSAQATDMIAEEEDGWYQISILGNIGGFQMLDFTDTSKVYNEIYKSTMADYTGNTAKDLYFNTADRTW